jgi:hypothetical protein
MLKFSTFSQKRLKIPLKITYNWPVAIIFKFNFICDLKIIISIMGSFWYPYKKTNIKMQNLFSSQYKSIDILFLYVMHNNSCHMHTQVNNLKVNPYWIFLTCIIQINHCIYTHMIKTINVMTIIRHLSLHQPKISFNHIEHMNDLDLNLRMNFVYLYRFVCVCVCVQN